MQVERGVDLHRLPTTIANHISMSFLILADGRWSVFKRILANKSTRNRGIDDSGADYSDKTHNNLMYLSMKHLTLSVSF